eukprot:sb/3469421/
MQSTSCDTIVGVVHPNENHWAVVAVDLRGSEARFLDSLRKDPKEEVDQFMNWVSSVFNKTWTMIADKLFLLHLQTVPHQGGTLDCGAFSCKFVQCIVEGVVISGTTLNGLQLRQEIKNIFLPAQDQVSSAPVVPAPVVPAPATPATTTATTTTAAQATPTTPAPATPAPTTPTTAAPGKPAPAQPPSAAPMTFKFWVWIYATRYRVNRGKTNHWGNSNHVLPVFHLVKLS